MEVYRVGSEVTGLDLAHLCFEGPLEELVETEVQQPTLVATSLAILAAVRKEGLAARRRRRPLGRRVRGARLRRRDGRRRTRSASCASAGSRWRRRRGSAPARWPRSSVSRTSSSRRSAGRSSGVWPANYNCPGQIVISGENDAVEECCAEAESLGARRAIKLKVSGAFHSPLVGRARDRLKPAIDRIRFSDPVAPFMSTVTAKIEPAQRLASLLVDQLTAPVRFTQAARELVRDGVTTFVEIGPGNVLSGLVKRIDRTRPDDLGQRPREPGEGQGGARRVMSFASLEGKVALVTGGSTGNRPRDRARARPRRRRGRRRLPDAAATRRRRSRPRSAGARSRRTSPTPSPRRRSSKRPATSTSSSTTPA